MPKTTRSLNLNLIRWLNGGHKNTSKMLSHVAHQGDISKMATGQMEISEWKARSIENALDLPDGWTDRDNISILKMSSIDVQIHRLVVALPEEKKSALLKFLSP
ncbi:MAG: hypothetical protein AMXMBFR26_07300 [Porticoccaceae bacterium]